MTRPSMRVASVGRLLLGLVFVAIVGQVNLTLLPSLWAHDEGRAGLVIRREDGSAITQCISFDGKSSTGYDLLVASGLDLDVDLSSIGAVICSIDNEGCDFPQAQCFCQCTGEDPWNYWKRDGDGWVHSDLGAIASVVVDGDVDAWNWNTVSDTGEEPEMQPHSHNFASICEPSVSTLFLPIVNR